MFPIKFENITHFYGNTKVLDNLNFGIEKNIITVIIGKSGCGKSTLLQIINGLIVPTRGNISVFGNSLDYMKLNKLRLQMGYAVQGTGLFPHLTAYQNIFLLTKIAGKPKEEVDKRIDMLLKFVDLNTAFKHKYPYQLSGGEQQRVGICRAMILNPEIFLLDEPFAALDPTTKSSIHKDLLRLQQAEPRTIVMVTHDIHEALKLADKIIFLEKGIIQQYTDKKEFVNNPANQSVRDFINSQN